MDKLPFQVAAGVIIGFGVLFLYAIGFWLARRSPPLPPREYNRAIAINKTIAALILTAAVLLSMAIFQFGL